MNKRNFLAASTLAAGTLLTGMSAEAAKIVESESPKKKECKRIL